MARQNRGKRVVFGLFDDRPAMERAVDALRASHFRYQDISILMSTPESAKSVAHEKFSRSPVVALTGGAWGMAIGGAFGWLLGIGSLAIPGMGPMVAAGPLFAALAGVGLGGTLGGVAGALIGLSIPKYVARRYQSMVQTGSILISVHVDDAEWERRAHVLLEAAGAHDVAAASEQAGADHRSDRGGRTARAAG